MVRVELLSPRGEAALAILRVSGSGSAALLTALGLPRPPGPGTMNLVRLRIGTGPGEQALVVGTGAGTELQIHGNPLLVERLLALGDDEPAPAPDLIARLLMLAGQAPGREGLALCLFQLGPTGLVGLLRRCRDQGPTAGLRAELAASLAAGDLARRLLHPATIVLRGPANAGKSTLLNLCCGRTRVRTGDRPGLTRDPVAVDLVHRGWPLRLLDTAGETGPMDELDDAARALARHAERGADLRVLVAPRQGAGRLDGSRAGTLRVLTEAPPLPDMEPVEAAPADLCVDLLAPDRARGRTLVLDAMLAALDLPQRPPEPVATWLEATQRTGLEQLRQAAGDPAGWRAAAAALLDGRGPC